MALKTFFSPMLVRHLASSIALAMPCVPVGAFAQQTCTGPEGLGLLDRGKHISCALGTHLPEDYRQAVDFARSDPSMPQTVDYAMHFVKGNSASRH